MQSISVVIADSDSARQVECARLLRQWRNLRLVGQAFRRAEVLPMVGQHRPRVLVLDLNLFDQVCNDLLMALRVQCPGISVVLLPAHAGHESQVLDALLGGARGYLTHESLRKQLCKALRAVNEDQAWVPRRILGRILDQVVH